ncbi:hypothetical protein ANSO36C_67680 (plasmid) [Nostoc cf. commune SO-36]|uniref:Uncharacterized protein n=1 Tax=Nostoc cf. commune SO-36 TaxID=449208 RepID=A0ABM7ZCB4_NOSCO|nr:hypothetical protein [Nostoc commune]BDI20966.1 hypothetical protein ANSO36C_67680 [Nostoc cf. commune SO-36]
MTDLMLQELREHNPEIDEKDWIILEERAIAFAKETEPMSGDFLEFADGIIRRISHVWPDSVQSSTSGSWYLGLSYMSFSGGLYTGIPSETLSIQEEKRMGSCWFFHHGYQTAHNAINVKVPCRVWKTTLNASR